MPVLPGDPEVRHASHRVVADGGFAVTRVEFGTHSGTHIDAPARCARARTELTPCRWKRSSGPARVIGCGKAGRARRSLLTTSVKRCPRRAAYCRDQLGPPIWANRSYSKRFPALSGAVERLAAARIQVLGLDALGECSEELALHHRLLDSGIMMKDSSNFTAAGGVSLVVAPFPLRVWTARRAVLSHLLPRKAYSPSTLSTGNLADAAGGRRHRLPVRRPPSSALPSTGSRSARWGSSIFWRVERASATGMIFGSCCSRSST